MKEKEGEEEERWGGVAPRRPLLFFFSSPNRDLFLFFSVKKGEEVVEEGEG